MEATKLSSHGLADTGNSQITLQLDDCNINNQTNDDIKVIIDKQTVPIERQHSIMDINDDGTAVNENDCLGLNTTIVNVLLDTSNTEQVEECAEDIFNEGFVPLIRNIDGAIYGSNSNGGSQHSLKTLKDGTSSASGETERNPSSSERRRRTRVRFGTVSIHRIKLTAYEENMQLFRVVFDIIYCITLLVFLLLICINYMPKLFKSDSDGDDDFFERMRNRDRDLDHF